MSAVAVAIAELKRWRTLGAAGRAERIACYWGEERPRRSWCAAFVGYCLERAGLPADARGRARRGARACVRWVAARGTWVVRPGERVTAAELLERLAPGDVACWRRGTLSWTAHVGFVVHVDRRIAGIDGNSGGAVRFWELSPEKFLSRLRGLYGVARPGAPEGGSG